LQKNEALLRCALERQIDYGSVEAQPVGTYSQKRWFSRVFAFSLGRIRGGFRGGHEGIELTQETAHTGFQSVLRDFKSGQ
jgi:hypothetical protein